MRNNNSQIQNKWCIVFFIILIFSDFITKISFVYFDNVLERFAGIVKLIFEGIMIYFLIKNKKINQALFLGLILTATFFIINIREIITHSLLNFSIYIQNIYYANRYLYIFIFIAFLKLDDIDASLNEVFVTMFKKVMYFNSVLIIIGFLFKIELFRSYVYTTRFGYDGIFSKHGEAVYYYMFFISILYYKYIQNKTLNNLLKIIIISIISISLGKKAMLLFLFLITISHIIFVLKKGKSLGLVLTLITGCLFFFKNAILNLLFKISTFWEQEYLSNGFWSMITSIRSELFINFVNHIHLNWDLLNYLFGMGTYQEHKVEFEFVDVFMFFGLIGIVVYIYLFKKYFYKKGSIISAYLLFTILITSFFSGALFISVTSMMFFYIVFQWINSSEITPLKKSKIYLQKKT